LKNQQYCILNKQYTKEEYFERIKTITLPQIKEFKKGMQKEKSIVQCENCFGRELNASKNALLCYSGLDLENYKYGLNVVRLQD
jgi:hypothetical protein